MDKVHAIDSVVIADVDSHVFDTVLSAEVGTRWEVEAGERYMFVKEELGTDLHCPCTPVKIKRVRELGPRFPQWYELDLHLPDFNNIAGLRVVCRSLTEDPPKVTSNI